MMGYSKTNTMEMEQLSDIKIETIKSFLEFASLIDGAKKITTGEHNYGGVVGTEKTMILRKKNNPLDESVVTIINNLYDMDVNIPKILEQKVLEDGILLDVITTVPGKNLNLMASLHGKEKANYEFLQATEKQYIKLLRDLKILNKCGLGFDAYGDNLLYDRQMGFGMIDIYLDKINYIYVNNIVELFDVKFQTHQLDKEMYDSIMPTIKKVQKEYGKKRIEEIYYGDN